MPRYHAGPEPGWLPFPDACAGVADGTGALLSPVLWCDTETGEVARYLAFGRVGESMAWDCPGGRVSVVLETHPAPLLVLGQVPPTGMIRAAYSLPHVYLER